MQTAFSRLGAQRGATQGGFRALYAAVGRAESATSSRDAQERIK